MTSREEEDLCSFGDFCEFRIKPLSLDEAFELIKKYGGNGDRAKRLINVINQERKNFSVLKEFLVNPLLVSLLYRTFEYKEELPYKKIEFYRQVYEALFNDHDKSKDAYVRPKKCGLAIREFESVLRYLAFFSMQKWCVEYNSIQDLIIDVREAIKSAPGIENVKAEDFVYDLLHSVPIFQKDGSAYRWAHKSFMEYFSAQCIYLEMDSSIKEKLLSDMIENERGAKYYNILDFYYDMDLKAVRKYVIKPFLENYIMEFQNTRERLLKSGFTVSDEMLDIVASTEFFLDYKMIYLEDDGEMEAKSAMELFDIVRRKYGSGSLTLNGGRRLMWHTKTKQNIYLPRLFNEKYIDLVRKNPQDHITPEDSTWLSEIRSKKEYTDNVIELLEMKVEESNIRKLYDFFYRSRNRIYCLDSEKCKEELNKINNDISRETQMNTDRFACLEYR